MKKTKKPNSPRFPRLLQRIVLAVLAGLPAVAPGYELQDISFTSVPASSSLKLSFAKAGNEGEYPLYFQKVDPSRGTLTLSFLDTETPFPLGRHMVEAANPAVEEILLKRITSPSGKNFLGIELRLKEPPVGEAPVQPQPDGALKVMLGKGGKTKTSWSLAKTLKKRDELAAKSEPAETGTQGGAAADAAPKAAAPAVVPAPSPKEKAAAPVPEPAAPEASPVGMPASLKEIKMAVTRSQEDISLVFDPPASTPVHTAQASADPDVLEVILDGVSSGLPRKEYVLPRSGLFKKVRVQSKNGNLVLRFHRASKDPVHILPREGGLTLTGAGQGESAIPFKWTSLNPDAAPPRAADGSPDPVLSAHAEGAALDAAAGKAGAKAGQGKGLSSSRIFSLGKGGKSMIILKDSAALKAAPAPKAKTQKKVPLGEKVERIDKQGPWLKVVADGDTGFIRAAEAAYDDEMTGAQIAALRKGLEAAEAAAASAAALAARKQAEPVQEAADPAIPALVEEAEPVRVAGPAAASPARIIPDPEPEQPLKGRKAGNDPKLSLAESPELADKLAQEKKQAEEERMRVEPAENRIAYNSYGRRDPFIPVEQGMADNGIDIDQMKVVGIIWQAQEPMAVLEHNRESGVSFTVKQGDPVHNGRVSRITRDQVTFDISEYGISRSYSLKLVSNKEGKKQ